MSDEETAYVPHESTVAVVGIEASGSMIGSFSKDPAATRTYTVDWSRWPFPLGLSILNTVWAIDSDDKTLTIAASSLVGRCSKVKVKGGLLDRIYSLSCTMTTNDSSGSPEKDVRRIGVTIRLR